MLMMPCFMNNPIAHYFRYFVGGYFEMDIVNVIVGSIHKCHFFFFFFVGW
jgi:hypothetical protein